MKFDEMMFCEGGCGSETEYVLRKDLFTIEQAVERAVYESCDIDEICEQDYFLKIIKQSDYDNFVSTSHIRYYPHMPDSGYWEIESGWTYCSKNRGAVEVWAVSIEKIIEAYHSIEVNNE